MDLVERVDGFERRHPWELSRLNALARILLNGLPSRKKMKVLDVGCGDGFISRELVKRIPFYSMTCIDTQLSVKQISELSSKCAGIDYYNDYKELLDRHYDLILMLDVIEHINKDGEYFMDIVNKYLSGNGYILVTAPAFQSLYGSHDRFLKHYRRYNRKEILEIITANKLECIYSGYLFMSLLPLRIIVSLFEKFIKIRESNNKGVGAWKHGDITTKILECLLEFDNLLALSFARRGVIIPGLTVWALCKKPQ